MKTPLRRRITPAVPFVLKYEDASGKYKESFRLSYDWNALCLVEETLGKSMLMDIGEILDNPTIKNVSVLLWAALQENHPEYEGLEGLQTVRCNLTIATAKEAKEACAAAFITQLPPDQVEAFKKVMAANAAGEPALPLTESPAPAQP